MYQYTGCDFLFSGLINKFRFSYKLKDLKKIDVSLNDLGFSDKKGLVRQTDVWLLILSVGLSLYGALMVCTATFDGSVYLSRDTLVMLLALGLGLFACLIISLIDYDIIYKLWPLIAFGCLGMMLLLIPFGVSPNDRSDAISWLKLGPLYVQPSEFLKIGFIITFSHHLQKAKKDLVSIKSVFALCFHAAIPILLVVGTGDMGSALIFICMFIGMMYVAGVHWLYFPAGALIVLAASPFIWLKVFSDIQRDRILALFNPESYPDEIWQQSQAVNAIKAGGFTGSGLFKGAYTHSGLVPECENDMIFSVVCEEFGFIGALVLLLLFAALAYRIVRIGKKSRNYAAEIMCYGVAFMIMSQVMVNIGMCMMILPVIGITLPFISAGGSSTACLYLAIGLVMSVHRSSTGIGDDLYRRGILVSDY